MKRLSIIALFAAFFSTNLRAGYWTGDANGDQKVEINDLSCVVAALLNNTETSLAMDANGDQCVDIQDVSAIATIILGQCSAQYVETLDVDSSKYADKDGVVYIKAKN